MKNSTKINIAGAVILAIIWLSQSISKVDDGIVLRTEQPTQEAWDAQGGKLIDLALVDPFNPDDLDGLIDNPFGLTIKGDEPPCVDTHNLEDVSCADKEAIVKYRKALSAELTKKLQATILKLEKEAIKTKYGLREC